MTTKQKVPLVVVVVKRHAPTSPRTKSSSAATAIDDDRFLVVGGLLTRLVCVCVLFTTLPARPMLEFLRARVCVFLKNQSMSSSSLVSPTWTSSLSVACMHGGCGSHGGAVRTTIGLGPITRIQEPHKQQKQQKATQPKTHTHTHTQVHWSLQNFRVVHVFFWHFAQSILILSITLFFGLWLYRLTMTLPQYMSKRLQRLFCERLDPPHNHDLCVCVCVCVSCPGLLDPLRYNPDTQQRLSVKLQQSGDRLYGESSKNIYDSSAPSSCPPQQTMTCRRLSHCLENLMPVIRSVPPPCVPLWFALKDVLPFAPKGGWTFPTCCCNGKTPVVLKSLANSILKSLANSILK